MLESQQLQAFSTTACFMTQVDHQAQNIGTYKHQL